VDAALHGGVGCAPCKGTHCEGSGLAVLDEAERDRLLGMSVTDLNADEDPDGRHTRCVVEVLAQMLTG